MLYSIIANFVMVARQVVYCEFRHGVSRPFTLHKFASICVASLFASICVDATQIDANIDTLCPA
jgi:hypothetical protein